MNLMDMLNYCFTSIKHRKIRSFLTVLGVVVGISSIVLLIGLVQGLKIDVLKQLEDFGPRTLIITPINFGSGSIFSGGSTAFRPTSGKLFINDFNRLKRLTSIQTISKIISGSTTLEYKDQSINSQIFAVESDSFRDTIGLTLESGRFLSSSDRNVAVLGANVASAFKTNITAGTIISLSSKDYRVIGVLKKTGNSFGPIDDVVFINYEEGKDIFNETLLENEINSIRITLKEGSDVDSETQKVEDILISSHRVTNDTKDFGVISPTFINKQFSTILDQLTLFLGAIASISLIVGGIGISNTMFMSIIERRKEIGTLKAIGATENQILSLFIVESGLIGLSGGSLGVLIACTLGILISTFAKITFAADLFLISGALLFSILIGVVSGTIPAKDAAKVDPIVALRYE